MSPARKKPSRARSPAKPARRARSGLAKLGLGVGVLALLALVPLALAARSAWQVMRPWKGYPERARTVIVEPGTGAGQILEILAREGVIEDARLARFYLVYFLHNQPLKAGEYEFSGAQSLQEVLRKLAKGEVVRHSITLVEGLTLEETAGQLAQGGFGRLDALLSLMRSPELIADLDPEAQDLEGYLFPETYSFVRGTPEREVVSTLAKTFRARWNKAVAPLLASRPGPPSVRHVVTLASIVEKEARLDSERPLIAAVYQNRLDARIGLMADPTVIFALKKLKVWSGNIHRSDLSVDSPYNTYKVAGLPPGPIASAGLKSLVAAAAPAAVPYLYFVSRNDGSHAFAATLAEHNANVERWQRQFFRDKRAEARRMGEGLR